MNSLYALYHKTSFSSLKESVFAFVFQLRINIEYIFKLFLLLYYLQMFKVEETGATFKLLDNTSWRNSLLGKSWSIFLLNRFQHLVTYFVNVCKKGHQHIQEERHCLYLSHWSKFPMLSLFCYQSRKAN